MSDGAIALGLEWTSIEAAPRGDVIELRASDRHADTRTTVLLNRYSARDLAQVLLAFADAEKGPPPNGSAARCNTA